MTRFGINILVAAYDAGWDGVPIPSLDIFRRLELRDLWFAKILRLRGSLAEGHGRLILSDQGKRFVDAYREDWPS